MTHLRRALALFMLLASTPLAQAQSFYPAQPILMTGQTVVGEEIVYPAGKAVVSAIIVTLAPGEQTAPHRHGAPFFAYILEGEITVDYREKGKRTYRAGEALMEAMDVAHAGANTGSGPVRILAVSMGSQASSNVLMGR
ncbi:MAG: cupin domain-containing protein [Beijerinckiaceae bacterium]